MIHFKIGGWEIELDYFGGFIAFAVIAAIVYGLVEIFT